MVEWLGAVTGPLDSVCHTPYLSEKVALCVFFPGRLFLALLSVAGQKLELVLHYTCQKGGLMVVCCPGGVQAEAQLQPQTPSIERVNSQHCMRGVCV